MSRQTTATAIALFVAVATGCAEFDPPALDTLHLSVADSRAATPAVAALGDRVVVTWGATDTEGRVTVFAATSTDGGASFAQPVPVNDAIAEPRLSGEQPAAVTFAGGDIAIVWAARRGDASEIRVSVSSDGGRTFAASRLAHPDGVAHLRGWPSIAGATDGRLFVTWLDGRNAAATTPNAAASHHGGEGDAPRQDLYRAVLMPDGTVREASAAAEVCFCCKTAVVVVGGRVAMAWRHIFPNSMRDIAFASVTAGEWDGPVASPSRVSPDNWQINACPDDGPSLATDDGGRFHVVWPTVVDGPRLDKAVFHASSDDGGRMFSARTRLDSGEGRQASHPRIAAQGDNLLAVWDERAETGRRLVMRRRQAGDAEWSAATSLEGGVTAFYPAVAAVPDGFIVVWTNQTEPFPTIGVRRIR